MDLLFNVLVVIGWFAAGLIAVLVVAFILWRLYDAYLRKPPERPGRKVDYRREDVE